MALNPELAAEVVVDVLKRHPMTASPDRLPRNKIKKQADKKSATPDSLADWIFDFYKLHISVALHESVKADLTTALSDKTLKKSKKKS